MTHFRVTAVAAALVVALAGCVPGAPTPTPTATEAASPTPTPTTTESAPPTPKPEPSVTIPPLAIPDCETIVPIEVARAYFSANTEFIEEQPASEFVGRESIASIPIVLGTASPARVCFWGIPNSGGLFWVNAAGITEAERTTLQGELLAAGYAQTEMGSVTAFQLQGENEVGSIGATHLFTRDVWIWCDGVSIEHSGAMAGQALDALRTANPALGL